MRDSHSKLISVIIMSALLVVFLVGCGISVKPRAYEVPLEDDTYYEGSPYGSYSGSGSSTYYYADPNYDPWTMGVYYQNYSGPYTGNTGSSGSSSGTSVERDRPTEKTRDSSSALQSQAPSRSAPTLRKSRSSIRERTTTRQTSSQSKSSSITSQKRKRQSARNTNQESNSSSNSEKRKSNISTRARKVKKEPVKSSTEDEEEENSSGT